MIGALTVAMLANAGINIMGGLNDMNRVDAQKDIEVATNNANAAMQRAEITRNYTGVFEKMVSDLGTQNNMLATAGIDKASTLFTKSRAEHEKAFLDNKSNMRRDIENLDVQKDIANTQSKLTSIQKKQSISTEMLQGGINSFIEVGNFTEKYGGIISALKYKRG